MINAPYLTESHQKMLQQESGITPDIIAQRQYRTVTTKAELKRLGFRDVQQSVPTLLVPIWCVGGEVVLFHHRPETPRLNERGKPVKYEFPKGAKMALDIHPANRLKVRDPKTPLFITEGAKKADSATSRGLCCIGVIGVWNFRGANEYGGLTALPDWENVALKGKDERGNVYGRKVFLVYDSDVMVKESVYDALRRLSAFLKQRGADVSFIYLPTGDGGAKTGLDDYFVGGNTVDDLMLRASKTLIEPPHSGKADRDAMYSDTENGLVWNKRTPEGTTPIALCNFSARIVSDTIEDDGAETYRRFGIEATLHGRTFAFDVPAEQFALMNWPTPQLGAAAILYPGQSARDHARTAIQTLSKAQERRVRTHTGWIHGASGEWVYCHGGGAIGAETEGVEVRLQEQLARFALPPAPTDEATLQDAIRFLLRFWAMGKPEIVLPVAAAALRAVLGAADFSLFLSGPTGVFKSELAALAQQHFGPTMTARYLPADWSATDNYLEGLAFGAKDALLVIDEFVPRGSVHDKAKHHAKADRVLRAQGNNAGRGRMRSDGSLRPLKPPRGLILSTGEDIPQGHSLRARMFVIEVSPGDIPATALSVCQRDAAEGKYSAAMSAFLTWLAPQYGEVKGNLRCDVEKLRARASQEGAHRRTPEIVAHLALGLRQFLRFAVAVGALTAEEGEKRFKDGWKVLLHAAEAQGRLQEDNEPTRRYLELLAGAISSGRAHLAGMDGGEPHDPARWGWQRTVSGGGEYLDEYWKAHGDRIGFVEDDNVYLLPDAAYQVAQKMASESGDGVSVKPATLNKRLHERGLLKTIDEKRQRLTVRVTASAARQNVLHLSAAAILSDSPSQLSQSSPEDEE